MYRQLAAASRVVEAQSKSPSVARERGVAQLAPETQGVGRCNHHAPQAPIIAKALVSKNGARHSAIISSPPRTPAPAPSAASPSGITQHEDAATAPSPAMTLRAANHSGEAGWRAGGEAAGVESRAVSLMVMARPCFMVGVSCIL